MRESFVLKVLEAVRDEIPALRTLVVIRNDTGGLRTVAVCGAATATDLADRRSFIGKVLEGGLPLAVEDPATHPLLRSHGFVRENSPGGILCLPFSGGEGGGGVLYLEKATGGVSFDAGEMAFLSATAGFLGRFAAPKSSLPPLRAEGCGDSASGLIGRNGSLRRIRTLIEKVRDALAPVHISGESGTGKELVARTIHDTGFRRAGRFVAVNCGAIPGDLLESELFGYARGAFTGAARDKVGLVEEASGGTFFLDEIGDLTLTLQAKLLRVLEERSIRRLGENRTRSVDVRFVSATHRDLDREVKEGRFREDLYYRLKIVTIDLPPLRERKEEIPSLVRHFLDRYTAEMKKTPPVFSPEALEILFRYDWPGNVRELQNEVQRCLIMAGSAPVIGEEHLSPRVRSAEPAVSPGIRGLLGARADFEKKYLRDALARCGYHRTRTAADIGITRQGLFKLLKKHALDLPD